MEKQNKNLWLIRGRELNGVGISMSRATLGETWSSVLDMLFLGDLLDIQVRYPVGTIKQSLEFKRGVWYGNKCRSH